ncbi:induced myeloid leukemia cell differentiation protein Mcl-1b [Corythoichthys intestinalis]|uniref:induced myeloid leukemia cell differentiation protein Mcl-1b n=1 Tax=Corythoichthys intestinalis TaxID=161448 RepID=UPI0025A65D1E|nr:induced myeloid leukemia cell differentiation protein Mcl-1b [Corythoichthys intestinalis]XP_061789097.1 induced myeloid leukemia cell differentiation protein Mcl-1 homolog [Nerophis lumbriciformis]
MSVMQTTSRLMGSICHQNGVVDGLMHYGVPFVSAAASSPQLQPAAATLDAVNGNSGAAKQRPTEVKLPSKGSFTTINHLNSQDDDDDDMEDSQGSPPGTPSPEEEHDGGNNIVDAETRRLISRFLSDFTGLSTARWNESNAHKTMQRVVTTLLEKHKYKYNGIINKLSLDDRGDNVSFVSEVAKSLFSDGTTNWGRVASLVAFGAVVSQYLKEKGRAHCVELVAQEISSYLLSYQRNWLVKNNSWDGFVEFFREVDPEATVRNTLMAFAGVAGIGATLALLIR